MTVRSGTASTQTSGPTLTVNTGPVTVLNWGSFNIQSGERTTFVQPSANSVVFNVIGGGRPSQIFGTLTANGTVVLANSQGFYFGPNSMIKVGGNFIATTAPLPPDLGIGSGWQFTGMPPLADIVNYGQISTGPGRSLFLIAENLDNHGELSAPGGTVGLYSGKEVLVNERADGRGLSATVKLPVGSVNNSGQIVADAGTIALQAQVVNQDGVIQANSVRSQNGAVELIASDQLNLGANSEISARGDDTFGGSAGGNVVLKSGNNLTDSTGGQITVAGGVLGGNGGNIEVSAPNVLSLGSGMDAGSRPGWVAGKLLLDPANIILDTSGAGSAGNGIVGAGSGSGTLDLNVNTAFANMNFSQITLEATGNITLAQGTAWNLSKSTGQTAGLLTLQAGGNIIFANNAQITDANGWSLNLQAGVNFTTGAVQSGSGSIYLNGSTASQNLNGTVQTSAGSITMAAGQDILVGTGGIRTTGGGNISLEALAGNINAGTGNGGYQFSIFGSSVSATPGGIATAAGGNVNLTAGNNIISAPAVPSGQPPGASGAYGSQPGDVTLVAGNQVMGNYTIANGTGTILAGVQLQNGQPTLLNSTANVGSSTRPISLGLISGSWNVWAANNIYVSEVRNPNGTFNNNSLAVPAGAFSGDTDNSTVPARTPFLFNYAPGAAANFWAGNGITLAGNNLPRVTGYNQDMGPVYPPVLTLDAGAGGITVNNPIVLYPSSQGALKIATTAGGDLTGAFLQGTLVGITMSDSGLPGYQTFAQGHASVPLHLNDPNPVSVSVSGDINSFNLTVPTFAEIAVAGNAYNFGFLGQNLSRSQTTSIAVGGDITYRGDLTSVSLADPLPAALFNTVLSADSEAIGKLSYNATTGALTFVGQMSSTELAFLLNPAQIVLNPLGQPILDANGQPVTKPIPLDPAQQAAIQSLYTQSQSATLGDQGLAVAGPGKFSVGARNIDLGISGGISVLTPDSALAAISPYGASLNVNATGNLSMTSSKITDEGLNGNLQLTVGGALDVGGEFTTFGDPNAPRGIFTTSGGNIAVAANGDVNLNGSRIAAYDGGNIAINSATGDVNAGSGGVGFVSMQGVQLDPRTGLLEVVPATIAGSGILATTLPGSRGTLGNITVDAPNGSINASAGGIIQIALNGASQRNACINLNAGKDINASGSGIIGGNLQLTAGGRINGILVGTGTIDVNSQSAVNVTAFGGGGVNISASGSISGTVISGGNVSVSGEAITANVIAQSVSSSGNASQANIGVPASNVAHEDSQASETANSSIVKAQTSTDDDEKKKKTGAITLAQKVGRVTVILPPKKNPSHL